MTRKGIYRLYVQSLHLIGTQQLTFSSKTERTEYLQRELTRARQLHRQFTYRRGEYLRVYKGAITFVEYDIKTPQADYWRNAERAFK